MATGKIIENFPLPLRSLTVTSQWFYLGRVRYYERSVELARAVSVKWGRLMNANAVGKILVINISRCKFCALPTDGWRINILKCLQLVLHNFSPHSSKNIANLRHCRCHSYSRCYGELKQPRGLRQIERLKKINIRGMMTLATIAFCSDSTLLANYAKTSLVVAPCN